ncbi:hypothetical protein OIU19_03475 [Pseudomonas sp. BT-42-2]|uniref:hypothetical protein n=1 Tax=Pseudomonas sp. BT-42-2 TaxID=2986927 RepID=UPI0021F7CA38|nr:hypothetical protein [Pseudomonas sp. BT-42-2]MCV9917839.1 hypothetical protein [Pseudomonas sp. BT-42-2]
MAEDDESSKPEDSKSRGLAPVAHSRSMRARTRDWDLILDSQERALGETRDIMSKIAELLGEKGEDGGEMSKQLERLETQLTSQYECYRDQSGYRKNRYPYRGP